MLTLAGAYTYMSPKYTKYLTGTDDYSGNQIPFDSKNHLNVSAQVHTRPAFMGGGELRAGADVTFQSKRYFADANDDQAFVLDKTSINGLVNFEFGWTSADETWELSIWGKNVTNKRYLNFATDLTSFYATPREYFSPAGNKMFDASWNTRPTFGVSLTFKK